MNISRPAVKRARLALRMREKSAAAKPVFACAARTVNSSRCNVWMISAARSCLQLLDIGVLTA